MAKGFFSEEEQKRIVAAIKEAEKNTSGEIQVHLENHCTKEVFKRAEEVFVSLALSNTALKNGVLFYLAVKDRKFAILGDEGINKVVPSDFWDAIKTSMQTKFKAGEFCQGLCEGIRDAGLQLKEHFPYKEDDKNELSDEISFGEHQ